MMASAITFSAKLPFSIEKKGKWYISSCHVLDVCSQGRTVKKAKENLIEAVSLFLMSCIERNTIDDVLRECGFMGFHAITQKPIKPKSAKNFIDIPLYLLPDSSNKTVACPA